jgi:hypothetical protein
MAHGDIARQLCEHIEALRRQGSTTALLDAPAVKNGQARLIVATLNQADAYKGRCPKINAVSLFSLDRLRGITGPVVIDLAAVFVALKDALAAIPQGEQTGEKPAPRKAIKRTVTKTVTRTVTRTRIK